MSHDSLKPQTDPALDDLTRSEPSELTINANGKHPPTRSPAAVREDVAPDGTVRLFVFWPNGQRTDLAKGINNEHRLACAAIQRAVEHAWSAGALLVAAKRALPHGAWLPWVAANCEVSVSSVQGYMRLAREWPRLLEAAGNTQHVEYLRDLPLRDALKILTKKKHPPEGKVLPPKSQRGETGLPTYCCPQCLFCWSGSPKPNLSDLEAELTD